MQFCHAYQYYFTTLRYFIKNDHGLLNMNMKSFKDFFTGSQ